MVSQLISVFGVQVIRSISTSACLCGKRNFRKFPLYNKRGSRVFKEMQAKSPHPDVPIYHYGVRPTGYKPRPGAAFVQIPQMVPEIIVPDLTDFKLLPYVSYRTKNVQQAPMTPEELFGAVYVPKITEDFKQGKLGPDNLSLEPSPEEKLSAEEAKERALRINTDII